MSERANPQRQIPSVDSLLRGETGVALTAMAGHDLSCEAMQFASNECRRQIATLPPMDSAGVHQWINDAATHWLNELLSPSLRPVLNLTGTVLHTNLGRAPMPQPSIDAMVAVATGASNLEYNLATGKRGDRDEHVEQWLCRLTGAAAATVVNNNAAAVMLALNSLAYESGVAVSRGELVEIGGSFRIPDIMKRANCQLLEVGTTNRTHAKDYAEAIEQGASAIMRVHTSNYEIQGFTSSVDDRDLARLAAEQGVPFINDLGSGALVDLKRFGLPQEITARQAIADGASVVTFSGDKLLGGPQCGLIVGDKESIDKIRNNPIKRALRCDKLTLAALESILRLYANPEQLCEHVPSLKQLTRDTSSIATMAAQVCKESQALLQTRASAKVEPCNSQIGSGALPIDLLPSSALVLSPTEPGGKSVEKLSRAFRNLPLPVIGRIHDGDLWFDLRCLEDVDTFVDNLRSIEL